MLVNGHRYVSFTMEVMLVVHVPMAVFQTIVMTMSVCVPEVRMSVGFTAKVPPAAQCDPSAEADKCRTRQQPDDIAEPHCEQRSGGPYDQCDHQG